MKFIPIISKVLTLLLFAISGFVIISFLKIIIEKVDQQIFSYSAPSPQEETTKFFGCRKAVKVYFNLPIRIRLE